jgi:hypothetical protein
MRHNICVRIDTCDVRYGRCRRIKEMVRAMNRLLRIWMLGNYTDIQAAKDSRQSSRHLQPHFSCWGFSSGLSCPGLPACNDIHLESDRDSFTQMIATHLSLSNLIVTITTLLGFTPIGAVAPFDLSRCTRSTWMTHFLRYTCVTFPSRPLCVPRVILTSSSLRMGNDRVCIGNV